MCSSDLLTLLCNLSLPFFIKCSTKIMKLQSRFFLSNTKELEKKFGKGEKQRLQTHLSVYKGKGLDR